MDPCDLLEDVRGLFNGSLRAAKVLGFLEDTLEPSLGGRDRQIPRVPSQLVQPIQLPPTLGWEPTEEDA